MGPWDLWNQSKLETVFFLFMALAFVPLPNPTNALQ